jgi:uncharacterized protein (DUF1800 family)
VSKRCVGIPLPCIALLAMFAAPSVRAAPPDRSEAFRFLEQATFGPTRADLERLSALGESGDAFSLWIDEQIALPPSLLMPVLQAKFTSGIKGASGLNVARQDGWLRTTVVGPDQLRQRVAFALSEILVVSQRGALDPMPYALASYYDVLLLEAFGNFRELLERVTLHPAMGVYLSMLGNQKPNENRNIRPDENYARELMQLFTIGLVRLNPDGSELRDENRATIPTYDQSVVEGFANVFTGWTWSGSSTFSTARRTNANQAQPMKAYPEQHSSVSKRLLDYPDVAKPELPEGQTPEQDLADALDNVFNHPNVGPFISRRLIQRLVTSNPSPGYVSRVAAVFDDDGHAQRGNLGAVVRAILLDGEARPAAGTQSDLAGKVKEPLLRLIQLWRAYEGRARSGLYRITDADLKFGEGHLLSPSVFNFFTPDYAPQGEIADRGLVAPEMQIATEYLNTLVTNTFYTQVISRNSTKTGIGADIVVIDIAEEVGLASDPDALVARLADKLLGGRISASLEAEARAAILRYPVSKPAQRVADAMYLIVTSPQFAVQR